jgi:hypothetical protein
VRVKQKLAADAQSMLKVGDLHYNQDLLLTYLELKGHQRHRSEYAGAELHLGIDGFFFKITDERWNLVESQEIVLEIQEIPYVKRITHKQEILLEGMPSLHEILVKDRDYPGFMELYSKLKQHCDELQKTGAFEKLAEMLSNEKIKAIYLRPYADYCGKKIINSRTGEHLPLSDYIGDLLLLDRETTHFSRTCKL